MATRRHQADTVGVTTQLLPQTAGSTWLHGIDASEHHQIDFDEVRRRGTSVVIVRAGRGTRQDGRWFEHVRDAELAGLAVGSYWYLYPSHTTAHHQAELWMAAVAVTASLFPARHWLHVATTDGLDTRTLARYVDACLRRMDELLGETTGVCADESFWRERVQLELLERPRWQCPVERLLDVDGRETEYAQDALAVRTRPADRGGPGSHRVRITTLRTTRPPSHGLHLVPRGPNESIGSWQQRWLRSPDVARLQRHLNELGASLVIDGVYGPATEAAVHVWHHLCRRDLIGTPTLPARPAVLSTADRTAH